MLDSIIQTIPKPPGLPDRARRLDVLTKALNGEIYDKLPYQFSQEQDSAGSYIPLRMRKPSVRYNVCRMVVEDSVSMLFGEGRFPAIACEDPQTRELIFDLIDESNLAEVMTDAATRGSVGSVAVLMRVLKGRVFWQALATMALTPAWDPEEPDRLIQVVERYQVRGKAIQDDYGLDDDQAAITYWFQRVWDTENETWFLPLSVDDDTNDVAPKVDLSRSVNHNLGFCPVYWIRNLPGGDQVDGACTFAPAIETQIEIEYRLSQGGRALQYASDPLMMIRDPSGGDNGNMVRSASNAILVGANGDAKMLQIDGAATAAVVDFCKALRDIAIETMHGNRANPDKLSAAQSGRAQELLYQPLINLTDRLRLSYGRAVLKLIQMVVQANAKMELNVIGEKVAVGTMVKQRLKLQWGPYFPATIHDKQVISQTLGGLKKDGLISRESAVAEVVAYESIADAAEEIKRIDADILAADARLAAQPGLQVKATVAEAQ
jgi:hypothetical protein